MAFLWLGKHNRLSLASANAGLLAFCLLVLGLSSFGQGAFTASLDRDTIVVGETVVLTLKFEGVQPPNLPSLANIAGLRQIGGVSRGMNTSIINGSVSSSTSFSVTLAADKPGDYTIPAFAVDIGGKRLQTTPLTLKVQPAASPNGQQTNKLAFLWFELPKTNFYVGEIIPVDLRLYVRGDAVNISDVQIPPIRGEGFTGGQFIQGQTISRSVNGIPYHVFPLSTFISPVKAGPLTLNELNGSVVVHLPGARRSNDPFDVFNVFGSRAPGQPVALSLDAKTLNVLPLPSDNVPPGFNGAIGNFSLNFTAGPTNVPSGDPITVKVEITGRGNLDALALPDQAAWHDFKVYPPKVETKAQDQLGIQGTKTFEQIVVPQSADIKELPGLVFSYFDPDKGAFQSLNQSAVKLNVTPSSSAAAPTIAASQRQSQEQQQPATQDIVPIKEHLGAITATGPPLIERPWFLGLQAVPILAWAGALVWRRRTDALANNPRLRRKRAVDQLVRGNLQKLNRLAAENKSDEFFATLFRLLQEKIGQVLDTPASAITEAVVSENLKARAVPEPTLSQLHELFQQCNMARYAPVRSSQELAAFVPRVEAVVKELDKAA